METKIITVNPRELKLLEVNARYMKQAEYQRLVENVKRDGKLTSVPFCCLDEDWNWEVLSGNHRVQAAIDAELEMIDVMVTEDPLTKNQKIGIQISHNSITGQDDIAILKTLYEAIDDVDYKAYSGLDDETLALLEKVGSDSMSAIGLQYQMLNVAILPTELAEAMRIIDKVKKEIQKDNPALTLRFAEYDKWLDTMEDVGSASGVKNTATTLLIMLDVVANHMDELKDMWIDDENEKRMVPISTIVGRANVNIKDGRTVDRALEKMVSQGLIKKNEKEKGLVILAESYMEKPKKK